MSNQEDVVKQVVKNMERNMFLLHKSTRSKIIELKNLLNDPYANGLSLNDVFEYKNELKGLMKTAQYQEQLMQDFIKLKPYIKFIS